MEGDPDGQAAHHPYNHRQRKDLRPGGRALKGEIAACNVTNDIFAMNVPEISGMLVFLALSTRTPMDVAEGILIGIKNFLITLGVRKKVYLKPLKLAFPILTILLVLSALITAFLKYKQFF